jgi:hypothetical protein
MSFLSGLQLKSHFLEPLGGHPVNTGYPNLKNHLRSDLELSHSSAPEV